MKWQDRLSLQVLGGPARFTQVLGGTAVEADSCLVGLWVSQSFLCCSSGTILIASKIILFWERFFFFSKHSLSYHHGRERESLNPKTIGMRRPRFVVFHPFGSASKPIRCYIVSSPLLQWFHILKHFLTQIFQLDPVSTSFLVYLVCLLLCWPCSIRDPIFQAKVLCRSSRGLGLLLDASPKRRKVSAH